MTAVLRPCEKQLKNIRVKNILKDASDYEVV